MVDQAWVLPSEPESVRFMNTIWADAGGVHDDLHGPAALSQWIAVVHDTDVGVPTAVEFTDARRLRDALRRLASVQTGDTRQEAQSAVDTVAEAVTIINGILAHRPCTRLVLHDPKIHVETQSESSSTYSALAEIAETALGHVSGGTALRACNASGCVLYFVKTHSRREWCSEACGNRVRAARHYRRSRTAT